MHRTFCSVKPRWIYPDCSANLTGVNFGKMKN